jgi:hypothetical protein
MIVLKFVNFLKVDKSKMQKHFQIQEVLFGLNE